MLVFSWILIFTEVKGNPYRNYELYRTSEIQLTAYGAYHKP